MFCPSCGSPSPDNAAQCQRCGTRLQTAAPAAQKFKGTMMMASSAELLAQAGINPAAPAAPAAPPASQQGQFARTVAGGFPAMDGQPDRATNPDDMIDAPTIMQAPGMDGPSSGFGAPPRTVPTQPQGTANVNATMAMDASAFGVTPGPAPRPMPSAPPTGPETGASTVAVDASAFGLGGAPQPPMGAPPPQPSPWGQPPAPQAPPAQPEISTGGVASTVAVDISQFGLGGAPGPGPQGGAPNPYGAPAPQPPQGYGGYNPGMQPGMNPGMQPGMNPGMQQGWQQGPQPAHPPHAMAPLQPPPSSGGGKTLLILGVVGVLIVGLLAAGAMIFLRR